MSLVTNNRQSVRKRSFLLKSYVSCLPLDKNCTDGFFNSHFLHYLIHMFYQSVVIFSITVFFFSFVCIKLVDRQLDNFLSIFLSFSFKFNFIYLSYQQFLNLRSSSNFCCAKFVSKLYLRRKSVYLYHYPAFPHAHTQSKDMLSSYDR